LISVNDRRRREPKVMSFPGATITVRLTAHEDPVLRFGAVVAGGLFLTAASVAVDLAQWHMAGLGTICGASSHPHCGWCFGAAGLVLAGLAAFAYALRPSRPRLNPCPSRPSRS
jgi:hypothetical protein